MTVDHRKSGYINSNEIKMNRKVLIKYKILNSFFGQVHRLHSYRKKTPKYYNTYMEHIINCIYLFILIQ